MTKLCSKKTLDSWQWLQKYIMISKCLNSVKVKIGLINQMHRFVTIVDAVFLIEDFFTAEISHFLGEKLGGNIFFTFFLWFFFFTAEFSHFLNTKCGEKNPKNCDKKVTKFCSKKNKNIFFLQVTLKQCCFDNFGYPPKTNSQLSKKKTSICL